MRYRTLGLVLVVLLAGCSGLGPGATGGDGGTATPAGTATPPADDAAETPGSVALADVSYPEGYAADGITDAEAAFRAHDRALADRTYESSLAVDERVGGDRTVIDREAVGGPNATFAVTNVGADDPRRSATWRAGGRTAYRFGTGDDARLGLTQGATPAGEYVAFTEAVAGFVLALYMEAGEYEAVGASVVDGETLITYEATGVSASTLGAAEGTSVERFDARLVVGEDGAIREFTVDFQGETDDGTVESTVEYGATLGGDGPAAPDWLGAVPAVAAEDGDRERDRVVLRHGGRATVPAGTVVSVVGTDLAVELSAPVEPGDAVTLRLDGPADDPTLVARRGEAAAGDVAFASDAVIALRADGVTVQVGLADRGSA